MISAIQIEHVIYDGKMKLFLKFKYDLPTIKIVKTIAEAKWSHFISNRL